MVAAHAARVTTRVDTTTAREQERAFERTNFSLKYEKKNSIEIQRKAFAFTASAYNRGMYYIAGVMKTRSVQTSESTPEHWRIESGDGVAVLNIPGLNGRARLFDVDVLLLVNVSTEPPGDAWLELTVEFDGQRQWSRRIPAHNPGQTDSLDYHQRLRLEAEQGIRVRAVATVKGVRVRELVIEAREDA